MLTLGYPYRPTKIPGGVEPEILFDFMSFETRVNDSALTRIGHRDFPHNNFVPLQSKHISGGGSLMVMFGTEL